MTKEMATRIAAVSKNFSPKGFGWLELPSSPLQTPIPVVVVRNLNLMPDRGTRLRTEGDKGDRRRQGNSSLTRGRLA